jgi:hypothetical protein
MRGAPARRLNARMTADPAPETTAPASDPAPYGRGRRYTIRALLFVATLLLLLSIIALWANRQVFDANNWADTSGAMLENDAIKTQLGGYLVDQVYANVDVTGQVAAALPPRLKPLAGPAANGLRGLAESRMNTLLSRPRIEEAWRAANKATAQQFINIAEGNSGAVTTQGNAVVLDLRVMLTNITARLGAAQSLVAKIPPGAGTIKIMSADQISAVQNLTSAIKGLAFVLPLLAVALFAAASSCGWASTSSSPERSPSSPAGSRATPWSTAWRRPTRSGPPRRRRTRSGPGSSGTSRRPRSSSASR